MLELEKHPEKLAKLMKNLLADFKVSSNNGKTKKNIPGTRAIMPKFGASKNCFSFTTIFPQLGNHTGTEYGRKAESAHNE
jgi:hypothetical protein